MQTPYTPAKWVQFASLAALCWTGAVAADAQYCNEMYPSDAYEADERAEYIAACLQDYGVDDSAMAPAEDTYEQSEMPEPGYSEYEGTVEDYVETLPGDDMSDTQ